MFSKPTSSQTYAHLKSPYELLCIECDVERRVSQQRLSWRYSYIPAKVLNDPHYPGHLGLPLRFPTDILSFFDVVFESNKRWRKWRARKRGGARPFQNEMPFSLIEQERRRARELAPLRA